MGPESSIWIAAVMYIALLIAAVIENESLSAKTEVWVIHPYSSCP